MITTERKGLISVLASNGEHKIVSDVSLTLGGEDEGLNPHELVEAALAACTSLTLELYAKRKKWELKGLEVDVKITQEGAESIIERKIFLGSDIPEENKKRLLEIADKCPIHKLLESKIKIQTYEK